MAYYAICSWWPQPGNRLASIVAVNQAVLCVCPGFVGALRDPATGYLLPLSMIACVQLLAAALIPIGRGAAGSARTSD